MMKDILRDFTFSNGTRFIIFKNDTNNICVREYIDEKIRNGLDEFGVYLDEYVDTILNNKTSYDFIENMNSNINFISNKIIEKYLETKEIDNVMLEERENYIELQNAFIYYYEEFMKTIDDYTCYMEEYDVE